MWYARGWQHRVLAGRQATISLSVSAFTRHLLMKSSTPARRQTTTPIKSRPAAPATPSIPPVKGTKAVVQVRAQAASGPIYADGPLAANSVRLDPEKLKEVVMYGELAQVTYDSFRNSKQAAKVLATPRLGDSGFEEIFKKQSMGELTELLQPTSLARKRGYKVIDYLYANSGWYFNDLERAVNGDIVKAGKSIGDFIKAAGKDKSPANQDLASYLQEQYNWIGFVAVSDHGPDGKQDLAIVFRGTITSTEWVADADAFLIETKPWDKGTNVKGGKNATEVEPAGEKAKDMPSKASRICRGFKRMYAHPADVDPAKRRPPQAQLYQDMDFIFTKHKEVYKVGTITCVGHSLGAALATLAAFDMAQDAPVPDDVKIRLCTFEGPKPGDEKFAKDFQSLGIEVQRIINVRDVVTSVPGLSVIALQQIAEATQAAKKTIQGVKGNDLAQVGQGLENILKDVGEQLGLQAAEVVQGIATWKENPFVGPLLGSFRHVCNPVALDTSSAQLTGLTKQPADVSGCHNLEVVLHMLDPSRDACLINKGGDFLVALTGKTECVNWWALPENQDKLPPTCPKGCHTA